MINSAVILDNSVDFFYKKELIKINILDFKKATNCFSNILDDISEDQREEISNALILISADFKDIQKISLSAEGLLKGYKYLKSYNAWETLYSKLVNEDNLFVEKLLAFSIIDVPEKTNIISDCINHIKVYLQAFKYKSIVNYFKNDKLALFIYLANIQGFLFYIDNFLKEESINFDSYDIQDIDTIFYIYDIIYNVMNIHNLNGKDLNINNLLSVINYSQFYIFAKIGSIKKTYDSVSIMGVSEDQQAKFDESIKKARSFNFSEDLSFDTMPLYLGYAKQEDQNDKSLFESNFGDRLRGVVSKESKTFKQFTKHKQLYLLGRLSIKDFAKK